MTVCGRVAGSTSVCERSASVGAAGWRRLRLRPGTGHRKSVQFRVDLNGDGGLCPLHGVNGHTHWGRTLGM
eukprot:365381-Chlamydomonas_euryale.AAC.3